MTRDFPAASYDEWKTTEPDNQDGVQCDNCQRMFDPEEEGCFIGSHHSFGDCCQCARCVEQARETK